LDINEYPWYPEMIEQGVDIKIENVFSENYDSVSQYIIDFIQSEGTTIVLCDGGNKKLEFNILSNYLKENDFILGHDYSIDKEYFEKNINNKIWNWCELTESDIEEPSKRNNLVDYRRDLFQSIVWICKMKSNEIVKKNNNTENIEIMSPENVTKTTFVTGLWNIKRDSLDEGWSRSFDHYLTKFAELLNDYNTDLYNELPDKCEEIRW
jgi:hypothetical protein